MTPTISVSEDLETSAFVLMATSYSKTEPAGPRLFRGGEIPDIAFVHATEAEANRDAALLQDYLNNLGKQRKGKRGAEEEVVAATEVDLSGAWWND